MMSETIDHAERNARGWMSNIREMVAKIEAGDVEDRDDEARETIQNSVLSVSVRSTEWFAPGAQDSERPEPDEFEVLLSTGGPALRITGSLGRWNQPADVRLEKQDWFKPWERVELNDEDQRALERFTTEFYFGD